MAKRTLSGIDLMLDALESVLRIAEEERWHESTRHRVAARKCRSVVKLMKTLQRGVVWG